MKFLADLDLNRICHLKNTLLETPADLYTDHYSGLTDTNIGLVCHYDGKLRYYGKEISGVAGWYTVALASDVPTYDHDSRLIVTNNLSQAIASTTLGYDGVGNLDLGVSLANKKIVNLDTPTTAYDGVNKLYVDTLVGGMGGGGGFGAGGVKETLVLNYDHTDGAVWTPVLIDGSPVSYGGEWNISDTIGLTTELKALITAAYAAGKRIKYSVSYFHSASNTNGVEFVFSTNAAGVSVGGEASSPYSSYTGMNLRYSYQFELQKTESAFQVSNVLINCDADNEGVSVYDRLSTNLAEDPVGDGSLYLLFWKGSLSGTPNADGDFIYINNVTISILEETETVKCFPPMTTVERMFLVPTPGQAVYDSDLLVPFYWNGTSWVEIGSSSTSSGTKDRILFNYDGSEDSGALNLPLDGVVLSYNTTFDLISRIAPDTSSALKAQIAQAFDAKKKITFSWRIRTESNNASSLSASLWWQNDGYIEGDLWTEALVDPFQIYVSSFEQFTVQKMGDGFVIFRSAGSSDCSQAKVHSFFYSSQCPAPFGGSGDLNVYLAKIGSVDPDADGDIFRVQSFTVSIEESGPSVVETLTKSTEIFNFDGYHSIDVYALPGFAPSTATPFSQEIPGYDSTVETAIVEALGAGKSVKVSIQWQQIVNRESALYLLTSSDINNTVYISGLCTSESSYFDTSPTFMESSHEFTFDGTVLHSVRSAGFPSLLPSPDPGVTQSFYVRAETYGVPSMDGKLYVDLEEGALTLAPVGDVILTKLTITVEEQVTVGSAGVGNTSELVTKRSTLLSYDMSQPGAGGGILLGPSWPLQYDVANDIGAFIGFDSTKQAEMLAAYEAGKKITLSINYNYTGYQATSVNSTVYFGDYFGAAYTTGYAVMTSPDGEILLAHDVSFCTTIQKGVGAVLFTDTRISGSGYTDSGLGSQLDTVTQVENYSSGADIFTGTPSLYMNFYKVGTVDNDAVTIKNCTITIEEDVLVNAQPIAPTDVAIKKVELFSFQAPDFSTSFALGDTVTIDGSPTDIGALIGLTTPIQESIVAAYEAGKKINYTVRLYTSLHTSAGLEQQIYLGNFPVNSAIALTHVTNSEPGVITAELDWSFTIQKGETTTRRFNEMFSGMPDQNNVTVDRSAYSWGSHTDNDFYNAGAAASLYSVMTYSGTLDPGDAFWVTEFTVTTEEEVPVGGNGGTGGGGTGDNFANENLTLTANRTHVGAGHSLTISGCSGIQLESDGGFGVHGTATVVEGTTSVALKTPAIIAATAANGQVFKLTDATTGVGEWSNDTKAFVPMTTVEREALTPVVGQVVYDTDLEFPYYWDGAVWVQIGGGADELLFLYDSRSGAATTFTGIVPTDGYGFMDITPSITASGYDSTVIASIAAAAAAGKELICDITYDIQFPDADTGIPATVATVIHPFNTSGDGAGAYLTSSAYSAVGIAGIQLTSRFALQIQSNYCKITGIVGGYATDTDTFGANVQAEAHGAAEPIDGMGIQVDGKIYLRAYNTYGAGYDPANMVVTLQQLKVVAVGKNTGSVTLGAPSDVRLFKYNSNAGVTLGDFDTFTSSDLGALIPGWSSGVEASIVAALAAGKRVRTTINLNLNILQGTSGILSNIEASLKLYTGDNTYQIPMAIQVPASQAEANHQLGFRGELQQTISGSDCTYEENDVIASWLFRSGTSPGDLVASTGFISSSHAETTITNVADGKIKGSIDGYYNCTGSFVLRNLTIDALPAI